jgi:hypothetical protein
MVLLIFVLAADYLAFSQVGRYSSTASARHSRLASARRYGGCMPTSIRSFGGCEPVRQHRVRRKHGDGNLVRGAKQGLSRDPLLADLDDGEASRRTTDLVPRDGILAGSNS